MSDQVVDNLDVIPIDLTTKDGRIKERDALNNFFVNVLEPLKKSISSNAEPLVQKVLGARLVELRASYDPRRDALMKVMKDLASENERKKAEAAKKKSEAANKSTAQKGGTAGGNQKGKPKASKKKTVKTVEDDHKGSTGMHCSLPSQLRCSNSIPTVTASPKANSGRIKSPPSPQSPYVEPVVQHEANLVTPKSPINRSGIQPKPGQPSHTQPLEKPAAGSPHPPQPSYNELGGEPQETSDNAMHSNVVSQLKRIEGCIANLTKAIIEMQGRDDSVSSRLLSEIRSIHEARNKEFASVESASSMLLSEFISTRDKFQSESTILATAVKAGNTKLANAINSSSRQQEASAKAINEVAEKVAEALANSQQQTHLKNIFNQLTTLNAHQACLEDIRDQLKILNSRDSKELKIEFLEDYSKASIAVNTAVIGKMVEAALNRPATIPSSLEEETHQNLVSRNLHGVLTSLQRIHNEAENIPDEDAPHTPTRATPADSDCEESQYQPEDQSSPNMENSEPEIQGIRSTTQKDSNRPAAAAREPKPASEESVGADGAQLETMAGSQLPPAAEGIISNGRAALTARAKSGSPPAVSGKRPSPDESDEGENNSKRPRLLRSGSVTRTISTAAKARNRRG